MPSPFVSIRWPVAGIPNTRHDQYLPSSKNNKGQPYSNLVAFSASEDLKTLVFATTRSTRKYSNLAAESRVSLLIDNRSNQVSDFFQAIGITATGTATELKGEEKDVLLKHYLDKHTTLKDFVQSPSCALLKITVEVYYLVTRFQNVQELHIKP
jgi:Pyridoxamine 5'-phosphate oxidase.